MVCELYLNKAVFKCLQDSGYYTDVNICQNSSNCTHQWVHFIAHKLYTKKVDLKKMCLMEWLQYSEFIQMLLSEPRAGKNIKLITTFLWPALTILCSAFLRKVCSAARRAAICQSDKIQFPAGKQQCQFNQHFPEVSECAFLAELFVFLNRTLKY